MEVVESRLWLCNVYCVNAVCHALCAVCYVCRVLCVPCAVCAVRCVLAPDVRRRSATCFMFPPIHLQGRPNFPIADPKSIPYDWLVFDP